jgi:hypothetical protein
VWWQRSSSDKQPNFDTPENHPALEQQQGWIALSSQECWFFVVLAALAFVWEALRG